MKKRLVQVLVAGVLLLPGPFLLGSTIFEEIICRVNNDIITRFEYQEAKRLLKRQIQAQGKLSGEELAKAAREREKHLLRDMIEERLLVQKAVELDMSADTDVVKYLDRLRKENKLPSIEALESEMRKQGINPVEFKKRIKDQSLREQVLGNEVYYKIQISTEEVKSYYESNQAKFDRPEQVRLLEILILSTGKKPGEIEQLEKKAEEVLEKARSGERFDELATEYSDGPTASQGGDLGYFPRGQLRKEIEDVVFSLRRGQISDILKGQDGFRILKVTEKHKAGIQPLDVVKNEIRDYLVAEKAKPALKAYLATLRRQSYIRLKPGYVDSGADLERASAEGDQDTGGASKPMAFEGQKKKKK